MYPIINLLTISVRYSPIYTWLKGNFAPVFSPILQVKGKEKKQAKYSLTLDSKIQHLINLILISKNRSIFIIVTRIHDNTIRKEGGIFIKFIRHFWSPAMRPFTYFLQNTLYVTLLKVVIVCRMYLTCRSKFNL